MYRDHLRHDELRFPNSEDVPSEETVFPLHERSSRKRPSFLQIINALFILVAASSIIGPPIFDIFFSLHIGVSQNDHPDAGLHQGDLLIIRDVKVGEITSGEVVIVHGIMGETPVQQHLGIATAAANSKELNVSVLGDSGQVNATESVTKGSKMQVVVRYFPKIGHILNIFFCNFVKIGFVFFVGLYNFVIYISKRRRDANSRGFFGNQLFDSLQESAPDEVLIHDA